MTCGLSRPTESDGSTMKISEAGRFTVTQVTLLIFLAVLDLILLATGISVLVRGMVVGVLFALPVAVLTRSLIRGTDRIRQRRN
jgi:hypothetical protein